MKSLLKRHLLSSFVITCFLSANSFSQVLFTPHIITLAAEGAYSVYAIDLDRDGDMDVLSASEGDDKITWYENDGNQNFTLHIISSEANGANSVYAVDVDDDEDIDVLSASRFDDKIAWYENDGNENFTPHTITTNTDGASSVYALDVDGDGDMDILSASFGDDKIVWYENLGVVGIEDEQTEMPFPFRLKQNYPNPFNPSTTINFSLPSSSYVTLIIYNALGEEVVLLLDKELTTGTYKVEWNATGLPSGVYFYQLKTNGFLETKKMILLK